MTNQRRPGILARSFWQRPHDNASVDAQMREEVETHIAMAVEHLVAKGAPRDDAQREARARFGDFNASLKRMSLSARQREASMNRKEWLDELQQDVRLAFRLFQRAPVFFLAAVLTLAIGIGANGTVFSVLQASLLQPLPYQNPDELVMMWRNYPNRPVPAGKTNRALVRGSLTAPLVFNFRDEVSRDIGDVAGMMTWQGNMEPQFDYAANDRTERLNGALVTPNFFAVLGARAQVGRLFGTGDESSNASLMVLSHSVWQRDFGGDTAIVGRSVTMVAESPRQARAYTVIGVLPREVKFTYPEATEVWVMVPWSFVRTSNPRILGFSGVVRLRPGLPLATAQRRAALFRTGMENPGEALDQRTEIALEPMHDWIVGETRPALMLLGAVAALLLLITCVTVANGLLARVSERQQELAVRAALGAGRGRLVRQLLTEGAILSAAGALAGTMLAVATQPALRYLLPSSVPQIGGIGINIPIIAFGTAMAVLATLLAAVAPALGGVRRNTTERINHDASRMSTSQHTTRLRQVLVATQASVATALLISASLLLVSFWKLGRVPLGFDSSKVITVETRLLGTRYRDQAEVLRIQDALIERVRAIPGVNEAALSSAVPFRGVDFLVNYELPASAAVRQGRAKDGPPPGLANTRYVDAGYFNILRIPLIRGRYIAATDRMGTPGVVVISASFAKDMFGDTDPIGQILKGAAQKQVVGVVADVRYSSREHDAWPAVYVARAQSPEQLICVMVRTELPLSSIAAPLQRAMREVDRNMPAMHVATLDQVIDDKVANRRFYTVSAALFALLALVLTVAGLTVVVSRVVNERRRELAIRSALGATISRLLRNSTGDVIAASVLGVLAGIASVYAAATLLSQFLFGITPRAPLPYGLSAAATLLVAFVAAAIPIMRFRHRSLAPMLKAE